MPASTTASPSLGIHVASFHWCDVPLALLLSCPDTPGCMPAGNPSGAGNAHGEQRGGSYRSCPVNTRLTGDAFFLAAYLTLSPSPAPLLRD
jgi:hypothetical protein